MGTTFPGVSNHHTRPGYPTRKTSGKSNHRKKRAALLSGASLLALALALDVAPAKAQQWEANPGSGDWNTGANWVGGVVPNDPAATAVFDVSTITGLSFSAGTTVDGLTFVAGAPAYSFDLGPFSLDIEGAGIVNNSASAPAFTVTDPVTTSSFLRFRNSATAGDASITTDDGGFTEFFDTATAGDASITNNFDGFTQFLQTATAGNATITNNLGGNTRFFDTATAGSASINNNDGATNFLETATAGAATITNDGGITTFNGTATAGTATITNNATGLTGFFDTATAGSATITNNDGGSTDFFDSATAGDVTIINNLGGVTDFIGTATAGAATITNNLGGLTRFFDTATAGSASIANNDGGATTFDGTATAGDATITNDGGGTGFGGTATAGSASITNNDNGATDFFDTGTAGNAFITTNDGGLTRFFDIATAGNATLLTNDGGLTLFTGTATGGTATVVTNAGGEFDISDLGSDGLGVGSIAGAGSYFLGSKNLETGGNGLDTEVSGVIADGGLSGGVGGSLTKTGAGTLTLSGANTYTGATNVDAGTLLVEGSLGTTEVTVANGAVLGGSGTIGGSVTINTGSTLAPGASIGTLTLGGDVTFAVGSTYEVEINAAGNSDLIDVGGAATLNGGTVEAIPFPDFAIATPYTILTAAGGVSGTFDGAVFDANSVFLTPELTYDANNAFLTLVQSTSFASAALTANQQAVATAAESLGAGDPVFNAIAISPDEATARAAFDALAGAEYAQNLQMNVWSMALLNDAVQDRVNAGAVASSNRYGNTLIRRGDTAVWASFNQTWGDNDGDAEAPGYDRNQTAAHAGIDHAVSDNFLLGFVAGYYDNEVDFDNGNRKDEDGVQLGLYGAYDNQRFYIRGLFGYANYNADGRRTIDLPGLEGVARGDYDVRVFSAGGEVGTRFQVGTNAYVTPFGALRYANARNDQFTETGAPGANLTVFKSTAESLLSELGLRFSAAINHGARTLIVPEISASWQHELLDKIITTNHAFASAPGTSFPIISSRTDPDALLVRAGVSIAHGEAFEIKAGYTGRFHGDFTEHAASVRFIYKFGKTRAAPKPEPARVEPEPRPVVQPSPPPAPPAPPPVTIPGPFLVFFDWDSSALDATDYAIIDEAVEAYNEFGIARIFAEGHADRSGPEDYNQELSVERAQAVMRALTERGVPAEAINIEGKGERDPRVMTPDGVREAQNRRVEITLIK